MGHNWPLWLGFRGGKGAATTIEAFLALMPAAMAISLGLMALPLIITRNLFLSMGIGFIFLPLIAWGFGEPWGVIILSLLLPIMATLKHLPTIRRQLASAENKRDLILDRWQRKRD